MGMLNDKLNEHVADALLKIEQHSAEVAAGLAQWQNGNRLTGARPVTLGMHSRLAASPGRLVGWAFYAEGNSVKLRLRDSRQAGDGDTLAGISLTADGASSVHWLGPGGVSFGEGLWLETVSGTGTVVGTVWLGAVD